MFASLSVLLFATVISRHSAEKYSGANDISHAIGRLYDALHTPASESFVACRRKLHKCPNFKKIKVKEICLDHPPTQHHADRLSRDHPPSGILWNRTCNPNDCGLVFVGAENAGQSSFWNSKYCIILFNTEPPALFPVRSIIEKYINKADLVLSSTERWVFTRPEKVFPFIHGSTWIKTPSLNSGNKTKLISIIASGKNMTEGHKLRHRIIERFGESFDVFGHGYASIENKETALDTYMYTVVIENSLDRYYFTEKIVDAFLTGTIPIYWGSSIVGDLFQAEGIQWFSEENFAAVLQSCTEQEYRKKIKYVRENFNLAHEFLNPEIILDKHIITPLGKEYP
jgi:hypothetical protein